MKLNKPDLKKKKEENIQYKSNNSNLDNKKKSHLKKRKIVAAHFWCAVFTFNLGAVEKTVVNTTICVLKGLNLFSIMTFDLYSVYLAFGAQLGFHA